MHRTVLLLSFLLSSAGALNVKWENKTIGETLSQSGKTYVSVESLRAMGLSITVQGNDLMLAWPGAAGGSNQVSALAGCLGETVFNGVWCLTVREIQPIMLKTKQAAWEVSVEIRNGTTRQLSLYDSGFTTLSAGKSVYLALPDNSTAPLRGLTPDVFKKVLPAASYAFKMQFVPDEAHQGQTPTKFLLLRESTQGVALPYSTKDPSFRIDLTCQK